MLSKQESDALNMLRWLSTAAIVLCHLLLGYNNDWCYVANTGVQVFFFLSGFLYGGKPLKSGALKFYSSRLVKLYIPYVIWVFFAVLLMWVFAPSVPAPAAIGKQLLLATNFGGMGAMWFLLVLFECYLVLPVIDRYIRKHPAITLAMMIILTGACWHFKYSANVVWCALYYVGYICGMWPRIQRYVFVAALMGLCWVLLSEGATLEFFKSKTMENNIAHALLGIVLSLGFYLSVKAFELPSNISRLLTTGGGYEVYLTHGLFMSGPLTVLFLTPYQAVNIAIFLITTILSSWALMKTSARAQQLINLIPYKV